MSEAEVNNFKDTLVNFIDASTILGTQAKESMKKCIYDVTGGAPTEEEEQEDKLDRITQADRDVERRNTERRQNHYMFGIAFCGVILVLLAWAYVIIPVTSMGSLNGFKNAIKMAYGGETTGFFTSLATKILYVMIIIVILFMMLLGSGDNNNFGFSNETDFNKFFEKNDISENVGDDNELLKFFIGKTSEDFHVDMPHVIEIFVVFAFVCGFIALSIWGIQTYLEAFKQNKQYFETITSEYNPEDEFQYQQCLDFQNLPVPTISISLVVLSVIGLIALSFIFVDQASSPQYFILWILLCLVTLIMFSIITSGYFQLTFYNIDTKLKCDDPTLFIQPPKE